MSPTLIARSPDLQRLRGAGYKIRIVQGTAGALLVLDEVPYVTPSRELRRGSLVSALNLNADVTINPVRNHQTWFIGEHPSEVDGSPILSIRRGSERTDFGGIVTDHDFSTKPLNNVPYADNYEKFVRYVNIISAPARVLDPNATAIVHPAIVDEASDSVFHYADTATSRARIGAIAAKLTGHRIAIIGLGGTGSYLLDLVAKTPVAEIHLYDGDKFLQHNVFRAPGAVGIDELTAPMKVAHFATVYGKMRKNVVPHPVYVDPTNVAGLLDYDFVFICVDKGTARKVIADALIAHGRPFIDVGLGANEAPGQTISATCRTTLVTPSKHDHFAERATLVDAAANDVYASNIQLAELNALNAAMAVIRWKQYLTFYLANLHDHNLLFTVSRNAVARTDPP